MNTKHTPGPWHIGVRQPNSDKFIYGKDGTEVANCDRLTNFAHENEANARLIAAAPDLLELVRRMGAHIADQCGEGLVHPLAAEARALIAKATGENI